MSIPSTTREPAQGAKAAPKERSSGLFASALRHMLRNRIVLFWAAVLLLIWGAGMLAPWVAPHDPLTQGDAMLAAPSATHWFGTDEMGRDVFSRVVHGARISLSVGVITVAVAVVFGTVLGLVAGYFGGWIENLILRCVDAMMAFPGILLAILIMSMMGPSLVNVMIAVGISSVPTYVRVVRGATLSVKEQDFVVAARALGAPSVTIMFRHILPNVFAPVLVLATLGMAGAVLSISGLSFLGLGAQPPTPEWGAMLSGARSFITMAWWLPTFPGLAIMISVLAINVIGDALRNVLDPRLRGAQKTSGRK